MNPFENSRQHTEQLQHQIRQSIDPFGLLEAWQHAGTSWFSNPTDLSAAMQRYMDDVGKLETNFYNKLGNKSEPDAFPHNEADERFTDHIWHDHPFWNAVKETYLLNTRWMQDMLYSSPGLNPQQQRRAAFWQRQILNGFAPTNFLATNPMAMRRAFETNGESVLNGFRLLLEDMSYGDVRMSDDKAFEVGKDLATTPGAVVYRNRLMEVIHYQAATDTQKSIPLVLLPPWINKYYVLDMSPQRSMVKFLVEEGFDVYIASWLNPGEEHRDIGFDDYLLEGADTIVRVAREISGSDTVHAVGYCIGGTLLTCYMAWLNQKNDKEKPEKTCPVSSWTLLTALSDFENPGDIEIFIDEESLDSIDELMRKQGFLDGKQMASSFRMLRANSLIWRYWTNSYLFGEAPSPSDVLFWNMDTTRMPEAMHRFYLREFYLQNKLITPNALTIAGRSLDLGKIKQPLYMLGTEEDHIAPWKSTFTLLDRIGSDVTATLSTSGHILGVLNPPSPKSKRSFWQGQWQMGAAIDDWQAQQEKIAGSWWPNWSQWLDKRTGKAIKARPVSSKDYPTLAEAPGTYVFTP
jgi:polyhydroxyalkanoate synthase